MLSELRIAFRSLLKSPAFLVAAVLSLTLAIGAGVAAFSVIDAVRFRTLPFPEPERLVVLGEIPAPANNAPARAPCRAGCTISYTTYAQFLRAGAVRSLDAVVAYTSGGKSLARDGDALSVSGGVVSPNAFQVFGARAIIGRPLTAEDDKLGVPLVTVLSNSLWLSQFGGDRNVIGTDVKLSDSHYTIVGVMEPGFDFEAGSQFWLPVVPTLDPSTRPSITAVTVFGRLAPGRTIAQLRDELSALDIPAASANGRAAAPARLVADPLRERYASATQSRDLAFGAIVACVMLIACVNLANVVLVRAMQKQKEFAVRAALGAGARQLMRPVLFQNAIIVAASTVLGISFAASALGVLRSVPALNGLRPTALAYQIDARAMLFAVLLAAIAAIIISAIPLRAGARSNQQQLLRGVGGSGGRAWGQSVFAVAQIACATILLTGGALMTRTVFELSRVKLGFDIDHTITATPSFPHTWRQKEMYLPVVDRILGDVSELSGVASVAARTGQPLAPRNGTATITLEGSADPVPPSETPVTVQSVSPAYFRTVGVSVIAGREFSEHDTEQGTPVAIVNQWAATRWWPGEQAIGRTVRVASGAGAPLVLTVVGVVADNKAARPNLLLAQDGAELYRPYLQVPSAFPTFLVRATGRPDALVAPVRKLLAAAVPDRPLSSALVSQNVQRQFAGVRQNAYEIVGFAIVGLVLALIGVYGVLAFDVSRRTKELGIRGALGATSAGLTRLVLRDATTLTGAGIAIGVPCAVLAMRLIRSLLFNTSTTDPSVYLLVALIVGAVSLIAALVPARRAARIAPVVALRAE
jgi:putative ABC transport system permease protein